MIAQDHKQSREQARLYWTAMAQIGHQAIAKSQQQEQRQEAKPAREQENRTHGR